MYSLKLTRRPPVTNDKCSTLKQMRLTNRTGQVVSLPSFHQKSRQRDRRYARDVVTQSVVELYGSSKPSKPKRGSRGQSVSPTNKRHSSHHQSRASPSSPRSSTRRSTTVSSRTTKTKTDNPSDSRPPSFPQRLRADHIMLQRDYHSMVNIPQTFSVLSIPEDKQYSSQIIMTFQSTAVISDDSFYVKRDEITIFQETHTGRKFVVFKAFLKPGDNFSFKSQRTINDRFQLTICINDLVDSCVSSCCEFPYQNGFRIGGDNGLFRIESIDGVQPCEKCLEQIDRPMKSPLLDNRRKSATSEASSRLRLPIIPTNQLTPEMKSKLPSITKSTNHHITNESKTSTARDDDVDLNDFHAIISTTTTSTISLPNIHRTPSSSSTLPWSPRESNKQSALQIILPKPVEILSISTDMSLTESPSREKKIEKESRTTSNPILSSSNETPYSQSLTALLQSSPFEQPKPIPPRLTGDVENFCLVYIGEIKPNQLTCLRSIVNFIRIFNDTDAFTSFLTEIIHTEIILLLPSDQAQSLVRQFHQIDSILSIYLLSTDPSESSNWIKTYPKITGFYQTIESIRRHLSVNLSELSQHMFPIFTINKTCYYDLPFTYTHLLKETMLINDDDCDLKTNLLQFARIHYADNDEEMKNIDEFERDSLQTNILSWYTRNSFIRKILQRAFRTQEIDLLYEMRFVIQCLHKQMKSIATNERMTVYQILNLSLDHASKLEEHIEGLLIFSGYLSAMLNQPENLNVNKETKCISVLFAIQLGSNYGAKVEHLCSVDFNIDVLINIDAIFRIISIEKTNEKQWLVNLESVDSNYEHFSHIIDSVRNEIEAPVVLLQLSKLLLATQHYVECDYLAELLFQNQSNENDPTLLASLAAVHHLLGNVDDERGDVKAACKQFFKSLRAFQTFLPDEHPLMSASYNNIGSMYFKDNEYDEAIIYHQKALDCQLKCSSPDTDAIATYSNNIGAVYFEQGRYMDALKYLQRAATVLETISSTARMPNLCVIYQKIAACYWRMDKPKEALDYYKKTLDIQLNYLPPTAHQISVTYFNLSTAYVRVGQIDEAVSSAEKSVEQLLKIYPPDHPEVKENQAQLEIVRQKQWLQQVLADQ